MENQHIHSELKTPIQPFLKDQCKYSEKWLSDDDLTDNSHTQLIFRVNSIIMKMRPTGIQKETKIV